MVRRQHERAPFVPPSAPKPMGGAHPAEASAFGSQLKPQGLDDNSNAADAARTPTPVHLNSASPHPLSNSTAVKAPPPLQFATQAAASGAGVGELPPH
jgi:hypothetical protein